MWRARNPSEKFYEDGKWHFMFFDTDDSSGMISNKCNYDSDPFLNSKHWKYGPLDERSTLGLMLSKLLHNKNFKDLFVTTFNRVALENFSVENVNKYLLKTVSKLNVPMVNFYQRFLSSDVKKYNKLYFQSSVDVIKVFYLNRYEYAIKYLNEHLLEY